MKIKIFVIILSLLLKNESKDTHYKYTQYTNKIVFYFQVGYNRCIYQEHSRNCMNKYKNKTLYRLIPIKETDLKFFSQE